MSILFDLSSDNKRVTDSTDDFVIEFSSPIQLYEKDKGPQGDTNPLKKEYQWRLALSALYTWYSYANVSISEYSNARFTYSPDAGATWKNVDLTDGVYSLAALNTAIKSGIDTLGDASANVDIVPNYSTGKVFLVLTGTYQVDFSTSLMYLLLGFSAGQVAAPITVSTYGANVGNINNSINSLQIHCDLLEGGGGSYASQYASDVLYTFVPRSAPYSAIEVSPQQRLYVDIPQKEQIRGIRVRLSDQLNRRINLRGEPMNLVLHLKKVPIL
jgi:hypothetical protein